MSILDVSLLILKRKKIPCYLCTLIAHPKGGGVQFDLLTFINTMYV